MLYVAAKSSCLQRFSCSTQETIFVADGNHDYRTQCAISGEPLIQSMVPTTEEEAQGYEFEAPIPLVKVLVGDLEHRNVYDVSHVSSWFQVTLSCFFFFSFGDSTTKNES